jgi:hypothetical protein
MSSPVRLRGCYPCAGSDLVAARACETEVFGRRFGNTADQLGLEYGPYEPATTFGAVLRPDGIAVGAVRLIRPGPHPLKTVQDASGPPWNASAEDFERAAGVDPAHTWDVASFTVDSVAAGADPRVVMALLSVMFEAFRDSSVTGFLAILDSVADRALRGLGVRMFDLPGAKPAPYLGSPRSVPVYRQVSDLHDEHAAQFPQVHQEVFHGWDSTVPDGLSESSSRFAVG